MNIVDDGEVVSVAEDNGEFGGGELLAKALQDLNGFNTLVCVTRKVAGVYVTEMLQPVKMKVIKTAVNQALGLLYQHLVKREQEQDVADARRNQGQMTRSTRELLDLLPEDSISLGSATHVGVRGNGGGSVGTGDDNTSNALTLDTDGKQVPVKSRPRGSGPNGRETIFERTERQARERHEREMQILAAKKLLLANRPVWRPKGHTLDLPPDVKPYDPNDGRLSPRDEKKAMSSKANKANTKGKESKGSKGSKTRSPSPIRRDT